MYFMALAVDYDGTLAHEGIVSAAAIDALVRFKESGRKLIMVTGRQLDDLKTFFPLLELFDYIVAENGALIYTPQTQVQTLLASPPPTHLVETLKTRGVDPLRIGSVIISTWKPQETVVLEVIRDLGLELEIIFNKSAVMVLPSGTNKATGLTIALKELGLSMHNVIGVGDAENDHAFLQAVGLGVAVANAADAIKQSAECVTKAANGQGVEEIINQLLDDEHTFVSSVRDKINIGVDDQKLPIEILPTDRVLIAGSSGIGKSTLATALTEQMVTSGFQFCVFDPEGDYEDLENSTCVGEVKSPPSLDQVIELLQDPAHNVVVNTLGIELKDRPSFFVQLSSKLVNLKASTARPHWLIIDEAHHLMPAVHENLSLLPPQEGTILITVHPDEIATETLRTLNVIIVLGPQGSLVLEKISEMIGEKLPSSLPTPNEDEVLLWQRTSKMVKTLKAPLPKQHHKRHTRKYSEGNLSDEFCFYFRGPHNALNLKVQNLLIFLQIAEGIDDETWVYHLHKHDYSDWFRTHIKDEGLAIAAVEIENDSTLSSLESREAIARLIKERYTAPASSKN